MQKITKLTLKYSISCLFLALVIRKIIIGKNAMDYVNECKHQVKYEDMISNLDFINVINTFSNEKPTLILIQNQHAINMTFNWLCNTEKMDSVHENTVIVTLDDVSKQLLEENWPKIRILHWPISCLKDPFNYGDGRYQLFYLFRSNLARSILEFNKSFWMIQQDTFWRENLMELNIEKNQLEADIIFDRASESELDSDGNTIIAGGYYFVRPTCSSKAYFKQLSYDLESFYAPDNAYMTNLCSNKGLAKCGQIPFNLITNWIWLHEPNRISNPSEIPYLIQFDGDTQLGGKLAKIKSLGFYFLDSDGLKCKENSYKNALNIIKNINQESTVSLKSYSHLQFGLYQWFIDQFYKTNLTRNIMNNVIFPYAHYFMLTI